MYSLMSSECTGGPAPPFAIGEQLRTAAAAALERADHRQRVRVAHLVHAAQPALGGIVEHDRVVTETDVGFVQRRQAEPATLLGVLLAADPEQTDVEQPHGTGEHPDLSSSVPASPSVRRRRSRGSASANSTIRRNF